MLGALWEIVPGLQHTQRLQQVEISYSPLLTLPAFSGLPGVYDYFIRNFMHLNPSGLPMLLWQICKSLLKRWVWCRNQICNLKQLQGWSTCKMSSKTYLLLFASLIWYVYTVFKRIQKWSSVSVWLPYLVRTVRWICWNSPSSPSSPRILTHSLPWHW